MRIILTLQELFIFPTGILRNHRGELRAGLETLALVLLLALKLHCPRFPFILQLNEVL